MDPERNTNPSARPRTAQYRVNDYYILVIMTRTRVFIFVGRTLSRTRLLSIIRSAPYHPTAAAVHATAPGRAGYNRELRRISRRHFGPSVVRRRDPRRAKSRRRHNRCSRGSPRLRAIISRDGRVTYAHGAPREASSQFDNVRGGKLIHWPILHGRKHIIISIRTAEFAVTVVALASLSVCVSVCAAGRPRGCHIYYGTRVLLSALVSYRRGKLRVLCERKIRTFNTERLLLRTGLFVIKII